MVVLRGGDVQEVVHGVGGRTGAPDGGGEDEDGAGGRVVAGVGLEEVVPGGSGRNWHS